MLDKGVTPISINNPKDLSNYLMDHVCDDDRLFLEEIANYCFAREAAAVFLFIRFRSGNKGCDAFAAVYNKEDTYDKVCESFEDVIKNKNVYQSKNTSKNRNTYQSQSFFLGPQLIESKKDLLNEETWKVIMNKAKYKYWSEDCALLVFHKKEYR